MYFWKKQTFKGDGKMEKILLMRQNIGRISDKILNLSIGYGTVDIFGKSDIIIISRKEGK